MIEHDLIMTMIVCACLFLFPAACLGLSLLTQHNCNKMLDETRKAVKELDRQSDKFDNIMNEYKRTVKIEVSDSVLDYIKSDKEI